tara:strand:+ start:121 stop:906 length:786 start_codon:yes stop_codon:yes gene_type:complete
MIDKIYIPTLGRVNEQTTYNNLPDKYKDIVIMVVQEHERPLYKYNVEYMVVPDDIGNSKTTDLLLRDGCKRKINFCMIDDQVFFKRRYLNYKDLGLPSKLNFTEKDYDDCFKTMNSWLNEGYINCGLRSCYIPPMNTDYIENGKICAVKFWNGKILSEIINDVEICIERQTEDLTLILQYLLRGYKNRQSNLFLMHKKSYKSGGCFAAGRTPETTFNAHRRIIKRFPKYIKQTFDKKTGMSKLTVKWSQAYKDSQRSKLPV